MPTNELNSMPLLEMRDKIPSIVYNCGVTDCHTTTHTHCVCVCVLHMIKAWPKVVLMFIVYKSCLIVTEWFHFSSRIYISVDVQQNLSKTITSNEGVNDKDIFNSTFTLSNRLLEWMRSFNCPTLWLIHFAFLIVNDFSHSIFLTYRHLIHSSVECLQLARAFY